MVIIFSVIVQPHFSQSNRVSSQYIHPFPPLIRGSFPEDMTDMRTRHNLQSPPAHPCFERKFQIFATPNVETVIVCAKFFEKFLKQTTESSNIVFTHTYEWIHFKRENRYMFWNELISDRVGSKCIRCYQPENNTPEVCNLLYLVIFYMIFICTVVKLFALFSD